MINKDSKDKYFEWLRIYAVLLNVHLTSCLQVFSGEKKSLKTLFFYNIIRNMILS